MGFYKTVGWCLGLLWGAAALAAEPRVPVLVELFTSEGCSSCPAADDTLAALAQAQPVAGAELVPLELHVDYWNQLGWTDRFSRPEFTERQRVYAETLSSDVYTPQMVVDGTTGFVASAARAQQAVAAALKRSRARLTVEPGADDAVTVRVDSLPADLSSADLWLAVTEDGLSTAVPRGENSGRTLAHSAVVRKLVRLGAAAVGTQKTTLAPAASWKRGKLRLVAWIQERSPSRVAGVATARLPP